MTLMIARRLHTSARGRENYFVKTGDPSTGFASLRSSMSTAALVAARLKQLSRPPETLELWMPKPEYLVTGKDDTNSPKHNTIATSALDLACGQNLPATGRRVERQSQETAIPSICSPNLLLKKPSQGELAISKRGRQQDL